MQMINTSLRPLATFPLGRLSDGFFRRSSGCGEIFFADCAAGPVRIFPVFKDGSVSRSPAAPDALLFPFDDIDVLDPAGLGIAEIKWSEQYPDETIDIA